MSVYDKFPAAGGRFVKFEDGVPQTLKLINIETVDGDPTKPEFSDDKGKQVEFLFERETGERCFFTRKSLAGFGYQLKESGVDANDWVSITRTGSGADTRYAMTKVEAPTSSTKSEGEPAPF